MPIYEYACATCGATIEVIQRHSDPPPPSHQGCGGALTRVLSAPSMRVGANDGLTGSTHESILRADDNAKRAAVRKKTS